MRDVPGWVESLRGVLLIIVWTVLILRLPAVRRRQQRPAWVVLLCLALGSVVIQAGVARWIDGTSGVAHLSDLVVSLVALTDFAAVWWFALHLHRAAHPGSGQPFRAPLVAAATMAVIAVVLFVLTPDADRYGKQAHGWWIPYAIAWIGYGATTAIGAAAIFWRTARSMRSPILRVSMIALALGVGAELPYLVIRAVRWFVPDTPAGLAVAGFWFSFTRFVVVALACSVAALEPMRRALLYRARRQRLYGLWLLLRKATPELVLHEPRSRPADLLSSGDSWELLHQRVVEIRDSITFLHDGWATPRLLGEAAEYAVDVAEPSRERLVAVACWIEATRREARTGAPRIDQEPGQGLLPDVRATTSTMRREVSQLVKLHRHLTSRAVKDFADRQESSSASSV
ncbi:MAB_1171c family putative transporter [Actinoplanes sp. NPDC051475]|uniref:MAB_1171c family putative transporter n=1 Tax=Actinoplanes sp. NPDC051475 TaxID=3157225 RepID=UPI00344E716D